MTERDALDDIVDQWTRERPDLASDELVAMALIGRMNRLHRHIEGALRSYFTPNGLDFSEFDILATLRRSGAPYELTAGALLRSAMVTSGAITNRVDKLCAKGLVERGTDPDDRRSVRVRLTDEGLRLIDRLIVGHVGNELRFIEALDDEERALLNRLLRRLLASRGDTRLG